MTKEPISFMTKTQLSAIMSEALRPEQIVVSREDIVKLVMWFCPDDKGGAGVTIRDCDGFELRKVVERLNARLSGDEENVS